MPASTDASPSHRLRELHAERHCGNLQCWLDTTALFAFGGLALWALNAGYWPLALPAWLLAAHFGLTRPLAFHDASHGTLDQRRWVNELLGHIIGTVMFVPLPVFRYAHSLHHARMATPDDPELWPFTLPHVPRSLRIASALVEIICGITYGPLLMLRAVLTSKKLSPGLKRAIALGYLGCFVFWTTTISLVLAGGVLREFIILYGVPAALAGSMRTLQKYTEHLGLIQGGSLLALSRTVACEAPLGQAISYSLRHEHHHGAHHRYAKIPYQHLPEVTELIYDEHETPGPVFRTYTAALCDMLPALADPRVGPQWQTGAESAPVIRQFEQRPRKAAA